MNPKVSKKIRQSVSRKHGGVPTISIEKSQVDSSGAHAKVLFRVNTTKKLAKESLTSHEVMEVAFANAFSNKARLIEDTIVAAGNDDGYFAFVKLNRPIVAHEVACAEGSGFTLVAANVFSDSDDNIWTVEKDATGKRCIVRSMPEDLQSLLKTRTAPHMAVASSGVALSGDIRASNFVRFYDKTSEKLRDGIAIDTSTIFDVTRKQFYDIESCNIVAYAETNPSISKGLANAAKNATSTFVEMSALDKRSVKAYLTSLYSQNKAFLRHYIAAVDKFLAV